MNEIEARNLEKDLIKTYTHFVSKHAAGYTVGLLGMMYFCKAVLVDLGKRTGNPISEKAAVEMFKKLWS